MRITENKGFFKSMVLNKFHTPLLKKKRFINIISFSKIFFFFKNKITR
jgi:hypothetical protein